MSKSAYDHIPVLLEEVVSYLRPGPGQNFVDATLGGGGYTKTLAEKVQPDGKVLAIDLDTEALENFKFQISNDKLLQKTVITAHGNFKNIDTIVERHAFLPIDGIVADIGLSSYQLDQSGRGISFQQKEILDMRFDRSEEQEDARFLLNNKSEKELTEIFTVYGEEPFARQIAKKILIARAQQPLAYTTELYEIIRSALPKPKQHKAAENARRVFQALRIAVNHELQNLETFLPKAFDLLRPGGRMAVVSFHSLEDRMVKQYFTGLTKGCVCPPDFPQCMCGRSPAAKILTKKPVTASEQELTANSRSKPAKLRVIEKI